MIVQRLDNQATEVDTKFKKEDFIQALENKRKKDINEMINYEILKLHWIDSYRGQYSAR